MAFKAGMFGGVRTGVPGGRSTPASTAGSTSAGASRGAAYPSGARHQPAQPSGSVIQKGYGRPPDARVALQLPAEIARRSAAAEGPTPQTAPLFAHILLEGASFKPLYDFFCDRTHELDAASGNRLHLLAIGDPSQSGDEFRADRTAEQATMDNRAGDQYVDRVFKTGREPFVVLGEMKNLAQQLGVSLQQLPCIAIGRADRQVLGVLPIPAHWYESAVTLRVFGATLLEWFASDALAGSVSADQTTRAIQSLTDRVNLALLKEAAGTQERLERIPETVVLVIDRDAQRITYKGLELELPRTAFRMLSRLAFEPNQVVSRDELLEAAHPDRGAGADPIKWAKDHKGTIINGFHHLVGQNGITLSEVKHLIEGRGGGYRLTLPAEKVLVT